MSVQLPSMSGSQAAVLGDNEPTVALLQAVWKIGFSYWQLIFPESMSGLVVGVSPFLRGKTDALRVFSQFFGARRHLAKSFLVW